MPSAWPETFGAGAGQRQALDVGHQRRRRAGAAAPRTWSAAVKVDSTSLPVVRSVRRRRRTWPWSRRPDLLMAHRLSVEPADDTDGDVDWPSSVTGNGVERTRQVSSPLRRRRAAGRTFNARPAHAIRLSGRRRRVPAVRGAAAPRSHRGGPRPPGRAAAPGPAPPAHRPTTGSPVESTFTAADHVPGAAAPQAPPRGDRRPPGGLSPAAGAGTELSGHAEGIRTTLGTVSDP